MESKKKRAHYHLLLVQNVAEEPEEHGSKDEGEDQDPRVVGTLDALAVQPVVTKRT
jgi:hypothetical protein